MKLAAYSQVGRGDIMQRGFQGVCSTCNAPLTQHHGDTDGPGRSAGHRTAFKALIDAHRTRWRFLRPARTSGPSPGVLRQPGAPRTHRSGPAPPERAADARLLPKRLARYGMSASRGCGHRYT